MLLVENGIVSICPFIKNTCTVDTFQISNSSLACESSSIWNRWLWYGYQSWQRCNLMGPFSCWSSQIRCTCSKGTGRYRWCKDNNVEGNFVWRDNLRKNKQILKELNNLWLCSIFSPVLDDHEFCNSQYHFSCFPEKSFILPLCLYKILLCRICVSKEVRKIKTVICDNDCILYLLLYQVRPANGQKLWRRGHDLRTPVSITMDKLHHTEGILCITSYSKELLYQRFQLSFLSIPVKINKLVTLS